MAQRDFLTDEIEIDRSPIPVYVDHVIIKRVYVTTAIDTGLFYGYPDTPAMRRNYSLLQKVLRETCQAANETKGRANPQPGEIFGVKEETLCTPLHYVFHFLMTIYYYNLLEAPGHRTHLKNSFLLCGIQRVKFILRPHCMEETVTCTTDAPCWTSLVPLQKCVSSTLVTA